MAQNKAERKEGKEREKERSRERLREGQKWCICEGGMCRDRDRAK